VGITELVTPAGARVSVHTLRLAISNAYLVEGAAGVVLADAGLPHEALRILHALERIGRPSLNLIYITHAHIDHFGGAAAVQRATGAPIAVHGADAADLAAGRTRLGRIRNWATLSAWTLENDHFEKILKEKWQRYWKQKLGIDGNFIIQIEKIQTCKCHNF